jgi:Flp pilus assembly CpaE family ATPase
MSTLRVAIVSRDPHIRLQAARAFDAAPASWLVRLYEDRPECADVVVFGPDAASGEGLIFDPAHPERLLEEIASVAERARVVVVTGGGRGVGVTTIALHLASVSAREHSTCLVDLDPNCGAAHRMGIGDAVGSEDRPRDLELAAVPVPGGFRVLSGGGERERASELLESAAQLFDRLVIDVPDGLDGGEILAQVDAAVMVLTPAPTSVLRAASILEANDVRWATVLNRIGPGGEVRREQLERTLGHRIAIELPCTPALRDREEESNLLTSAFLRWPRRLVDLYRALESA